VVCVITSNIFKDEYSLSLLNENLEVGVLPESSVVKVHKLFTIDKKRILKKFSVVTPDYLDAVKKNLDKLFSNQNK
jgi:mRNA-degrading endonuclease toxin of MazEF toxin-antitoxin module